jgi:hypothetical protein
MMQVKQSLYSGDANVEREPRDWSPRAGRKKVGLSGVGVWADGSSAAVLVSNISYQGCQLWSDHPIVYGESLTLTLPGYGTIDAQIRWEVDGCAGVRFLTGSSAVDDRRARIGV